MKLVVKVRPGAREERVERVDDSRFIVSVKARALEGRANAAALKALANFLDIAPSRLRIVSGLAYKEKIVEVE